MRSPRLPRRPRKMSRRSSRRTRVNPNESPAPLGTLDLTGPSELVRTRSGRKEQFVTDVTAPQPTNFGQDSCPVEKVAAVIVPVNISLVAWARREADRVARSKLSPDEIGRVLVLAESLAALPTYTPDSWEKKGIPAVKLGGKSREVFLSECAPQTDATTPVYLVQVSSPSAPLGSLVGSTGGVDFTHHSGLVRFVLENARAKTDTAGRVVAFGVQFLLPEDYLQKGGDGEEVPTFYSADFFSSLREYVLDEVQEAGLPEEESQLLSRRRARYKARGITALQALAREINRQSYQIASAQAGSSKSKLARYRADLLSSCLVRLGPLLNEACYFPRVWTHRSMPVVPERRKRAIQNLMSRVIMAVASEGDAADLSKWTFPKMLAETSRDARDVTDLASFAKWLRTKNPPKEVEARLLYAHTIVPLGVTFGEKPVVFRTEGGGEFEASSTDEVASVLSAVPGVEHSQSGSLWIGWASDPKAIIVWPQVLPNITTAAGAAVLPVPDKAGKLIAGARKGSFVASSRTTLAKTVPQGVTALVRFSEDPEELVWAVTCEQSSKGESEFSARLLAPEYQVVLRSVISGPGEAAEVFRAFSFEGSVRVPKEIGPKTYGKHLRDASGDLLFLPREVQTLHFASLKRENKALVGPVLRMEAFPDPLASDDEIKAGLVPMVSSIKEFPTLRAALKAPKLGPKFKQYMLARAADLSVNTMAKPSVALEPLLLYAVALKKPLRDAPRGLPLGGLHDPRMLYFLTKESYATDVAGGRSEMQVLPWTDHHKSLLHRGFMADVGFLPNGKIRFSPRDGAEFKGQFVHAPLFNPRFYLDNRRVKAIFESLKAQAAAEARANPELSAGAETEVKMPVPRTQGIPDYEPLRKEFTPEEDRLFREAVSKYLSYLFMQTGANSELSARGMRAALADATVRQAVRLPSGAYGPKASKAASRWGVAARSRRAPTGWEPNLLGVMADSGMLYGPDEMDVAPARGDDLDLASETSLLRAALASYDVELKPDAKGKLSRAAQVKALRELRAKVEASPLDTFDKEELEYIPAPRTRSYLGAAEGYGHESAPEDEIIARLNPSDYAEYLAKQLAGEEEGGEVPQASLDYRATRAAFPRRYGKKAETAPLRHAERIASQGKFVQFKRRRGVDDFALSDYASKLEGQAGFSVPETRAVIDRLNAAYSRRFKTTIPASSAACAVNRVQKLKGYRFPRAIMNAGRPGFERKKVVIWVSPQEDAGDARVMTYRRGSHLDCDIRVGPTRSLGQAMALALQNTLMWLAQKEGRLRDTYVYVGRVGDPTLNLAWAPGNELSFSTMLSNLDTDAGSVTVEMDSARDINNYQKAVLGVLGPVTEVIQQKLAPARPADPEPEEVVEVIEEPGAMDEPSVDDIFLN